MARRFYVRVQLVENLLLDKQSKEIEQVVSAAVSTDASRQEAWELYEGLLQFIEADRQASKEGGQG